MLRAAIADSSRREELVRGVRQFLSRPNGEGFNRHRPLLNTSDNYKEPSAKSSSRASGRLLLANRSWRIRLSGVLETRSRASIRSPQLPDRRLLTTFISFLDMGRRRRQTTTPSIPALMTPLLRGRVIDAQNPDTPRTAPRIQKSYFPSIHLHPEVYTNINGM